MKTLITTAAAALLIAGTAYAASNNTAETAGKTDDQTVVEAQERAENPPAYSVMLIEWDTNQDGYLTREEYEAGAQTYSNPDDIPGWDELDAAHADPQGRLMLADHEKWYPADALTEGTSQKLGTGK